MTETDSRKKENGKRTVIMLCLSASPSSRKVIRAAADFLAVPDSEGIAVYAGSPEEIANQTPQLRENIEMARSLGFEFHALESDDILVSITEFAGRTGADHLFVGSTPAPVLLQTKRPFSEQLTNALPGVIIHVIPDSLSSSVHLSTKNSASGGWKFHDLFLVLMIMAAATLLCYVVYLSRYSNANIITIYILAVLIASLWTSHQIYGIMAAVLYILLFNFLFIDPRFTLLVYDPEYLMTYFVTMAAAIITSSLAVRVKAVARRSAENAYQAKVLLDTSNQLAGAESTDEIIRITCMQLVNLLNRSVIFYRDRPEEGDPEVYPRGEKPVSQNVLEEERDAVDWVFDHRHYAGAFTSRRNEYTCQYLSIHTDEHSYGVIGIDMEKRPFSEFENMILHSILHEFSMAMENARIEMERQRAEINAENERMRAAFLRSISHDLRTPLTSIYGNAANLSDNEAYMSEEDRRKIYEDIAADAAWLADEMENILSITKLEADPLIQLNVENVEDVIEESLRHTGSHPDHTIRVNLPEEPLFAEMDPKLISQVLINLISNAVKYTPENTEIEIAAEKEDGRIVISVSDQGNGIDDADKERVFELFFTQSSPYADASRSMGIGLNVCRMIVQAHGSTLELRDNVPHGCIFSFSLKAKEFDYE